MADDETTEPTPEPPARITRNVVLGITTSQAVDVTKGATVNVDFPGNISVTALAPRIAAGDPPSPTEEGSLPAGSLEPGSMTPQETVALSARATLGGQGSALLNTSPLNTFMLNAPPHRQTISDAALSTTTGEPPTPDVAMEHVGRYTIGAGGSPPLDDRARRDYAAVLVEDAQGPNAAVMSTTDAFEPIGPPPSRTPDPAVRGPHGPSEADAATRLSATGSMSADAAVMPAQTHTAALGRPAQIIDRLSNRPADIRDAALLLAGVIKSEIDRLNRTTPNGDELPKHKAFTSFLEIIADGLHKLADALDRSIEAAHKSPTQEKMFLGTAAKVVERLQVDVDDYVKNNPGRVGGCLVSLTFIAAATNFLHVFGVTPDVAAGIAAGILGANSLTKKK
jgi:hypothetical protein